MKLNFKYFTANHLNRWNFSNEDPIKWPLIIVLFEFNEETLSLLEKSDIANVYNTETDKCVAVSVYKALMTILVADATIFVASW